MFANKFEINFFKFLRLFKVNFFLKDFLEYRKSMNVIYFKTQDKNSKNYIKIIKQLTSRDIIVNFGDFLNPRKKVDQNIKQD